MDSSLFMVLVSLLLIPLKHHLFSVLFLLPFLLALHHYAVVISCVSQAWKNVSAEALSAQSQLQM